MNSYRTSHSSVGLNNSMLWIMGGYSATTGGYANFLNMNATEFVTIEGAVNGPTLPTVGLYDHCAVHFPGNGNVYLIGGTRQGGPCNRQTGCVQTNEVWVANPSNGFTFAQGPKLSTPRSGHACGTMSIGTKSIIVAAGGLTSNPQRPIWRDGYGQRVKMVEILDPLTNQWVTGTKSGSWQIAVIAYFLNAMYV